MDSKALAILDRVRAAAPKRARTEGFQAQGELLDSIRTPVIFDVGAMIGDTSAVYRHLFPKAQIYAFEPFANSFAMLERNFAEDNEFSAFQIALGAQSGKRKFHINSVAPTNSFLATDVRAARVWGNVAGESIAIVDVPVTTIDLFATEHGIDRIDLLKIDVQGAELDVMKGAEKTATEGRIQLVYTEILVAPTYEGQRTLSETFACFEAMGFELINLFNLNTKDSHLRQMDALFEHRTRGSSQWG